MSWNCGNGNHQLSVNYFPNILLLYYPLLLYDLLLYIHVYVILYIIIYDTHIYCYFYYYVIILSNYFPKFQFSVMAMVVAIMPFGRLSSKIYIKFRTFLPEIAAHDCDVNPSIIENQHNSVFL